MSTRRGGGRGRGGLRAFAAAALVAGVAVVVAVGAGALAQPFAERILAYDVDMRIETSGSLHVVERIDYDFGANSRHGIFRDIPVRFPYDETHDRVYPVDVLSVDASSGTPDQYELEEEGQLLRIRIGDPDTEITGRHAYTIVYRVEGALNGFPGHDELYWNAVGTEWSVPVGEATARVTAPAEILQVACFAGPQGSSLPCAVNDVAGSAATFSHPGLDAYEGLTVVVGIPTGVVPAPSPVLEERWSLGRAFELTPLTGAVAGGLLLAVIGFVGRLLWVTGRDRRAIGSGVDVAFAAAGSGEQAVPLFESGSSPVEYVPPEEIRPGQVGTLLDEVANPLDVTATIVDLAVRGYLRIEEIPKRWLFGKADWRLVKTKEADEGLLEYERILLDALFEDADEAELLEVTSGLAPPRPDVRSGGAATAVGVSPPLGAGTAVEVSPALAAVRLSELKRQFAGRLHKVQEALYRDVARRGWFAGRPDKIRSRWAGLGWAAFLGGAGLIFVAAWKTHLGLIPIPLALGGLLLIWGSQRMPRRTPKGTGLVRRLHGFRTYIDTAEADEARFAERAHLFSRYLPYAVVFGLTEKWARAFAHLDRAATETSWYVGARPFTADGFSDSVQSFAVTTAGTIAATASSSGSSGFGGGGSSGGGGGGGGGGSW